MIYKRKHPLSNIPHYYITDSFTYIHECKISSVYALLYNMHVYVYVWFYYTIRTQSQCNASVWTLLHIYIITAT